MSGDKRPVVLIDELADMLATSRRTIERHLRARTFPIPELKGIDLKHRWSRAVVEAFISNGGYVQSGRSRKAA
jgi:hypothetical protein